MEIAVDKSLFYLLMNKPRRDTDMIKPGQRYPEKKVDTRRDRKES